MVNQHPVVLLTESEAVVGLDLWDALETAGYRVLGPFATGAEARAAIEQETPTLAVIDIVLRDGPCTEMVEALRQRGVPFLVHSDLPPNDQLARNFEGSAWLSKPALPWDVVSALDELSLTTSAPRDDELRVSRSEPRQGIDRLASLGNPFVRKLEGFTSLSDADRLVLEHLSANPRIVAPNTDLIREGDAPDGVFLVMEGFACRHKIRANGARQISAYLVPGDLCDLNVALLGAMDHTITTLSACKVVRIAPKTIADLLENHPDVARALRMTRLVDEATLREWLMNVGRRSAGERIAHLFCELLVRLQAVGLASVNSYRLPVTQTDLADTTGLSTVHVNRSLMELRRQGLIELRGSHLKLLNLERMKALAEFRSNYLHLGEQAAA